MLNLPDIVTKSELDNYFKTISSNIKRIRQEKGMSQLEVALSIGQQSSGFYANAENYAHSKKFNLEHLCKLAKLFDVSVADFFEPTESDTTKTTQETSKSE
ncbi:MAG: helix-turn-helix transcriptional regulator [Campylobacterota bacterium]|nr:helix-turn-helix transcriptional regulator [Campylobacterota bacterium]